VREIGCCNFSGQQIQEAADTSAARKLRAFASAQNRLNLLRQEAMDEVVPACEKNGLGFLPFFPLASGLLTGKYRRGEPPPAGSRMAENVSPELAKKALSDKTLAKVEALEKFAAERGRSVLELAVAWLAAQPRVSSVIAGASRPEQVLANAKGLSWKLDAGEAAKAAALAR
jgi:aryl-alcohol dehydrogenase-like predicted oxidoreductase